MELSFIWVEEFRNIKDQGFNISSRYIFEFNRQTDRLIIRSNPKHIDNFFGSGISNITGIVGQNGAGKTNLLELINYTLNGGNTKIDKPFFVVYEVEPGIFEGYQHQMQVLPSVNYEIRFQSYQKVNPHFDVIHFSNAFDGRKHDFSKNTIDLSTNRFLVNQFGENFQKLFYNDVQSQIGFLNSSEFNLLQITDGDNHIESIYPDRVRLTSPSWGNILSRSKNFDKKVSELLGREVHVLYEFCITYRKKINDNQSEWAIYYFTAFLILIDYVLNGLFLSEKPEQNQPYDYEQPEKSLLNEIIKLINSLTSQRINEIHERITRDLSSFFDRDSLETSNRVRFLNSLSNFDFSGVTKTNQGKYTNSKLQFALPYNGEVGEFIDGYLKSTSNLSLTYNIEWEGISTGHRAFLSLFSRFYSNIKEIRRDHVLITIDEGDLYFHPKWQVEFLYRLVNILPPLLQKSTIQIVLTTHSPFLVSDLLKSNLIFLKRDDNGNCKVIPTQQIEGDTFGGNIGELYLDAFFLNGNLISQFALTKMKDILAKVKSKQQLDEQEKILVNQIGDEMIKSRIQQLMNDTNR